MKPTFYTKKKKVFQVILIAGFLTLHFYIKYLTRPTSSEFAGAKNGETMGSFKGTTKDGQPIDLASLAKQHQLVVINFWETWCGPCQTELPYLQKIYTTNKDNGLEIIGIYQNSSADSVSEMIEKNHLTFTFVHDENKSISKQFNIMALPTTIVTDQNLKILRSHEGIDFGLDDFIKSHLTKDTK